MTTTIPGFRWVRTSYDADGNHFETYRCLHCSEEIKDRVIHLAEALRAHAKDCEPEPEATRADSVLRFPSTSGHCS